MIVLKKLLESISQAFKELTLKHITLMVLSYAAISWLLLFFAGEKDLVSGQNFFYWLVVTGSTVGYGDYSPTTTFGKNIVAIWVIPVGLTLFTLSVARLGTNMAHIINRANRGLKALIVENHVLVIGWNEKRTLRLLDILLNESKRLKKQIVLCVEVDMENPRPDKIGFVSVKSYTDKEDMERAGISKASSIIIDTPQDDVTLTTALFCNGMNPSCHKTAYFEDESLSNLLKMHCPNVESVPSVSLEMLAKATLDPGSSGLHRELLDPIEGMTQYSNVYDGAKGDIHVRTLFTYMKEKLEATIIGLQEAGSSEMIVNPSLDQVIRKNTRVFYVADERLTSEEIFNHV